MSLFSYRQKTFIQEGAFFPWWVITVSWNDFAAYFNHLRGLINECFIISVSEINVLMLFCFLKLLWLSCSSGYIYLKRWCGIVLLIHYLFIPRRLNTWIEFFFPGHGCRLTTYLILTFYTAWNNLPGETNIHTLIWNLPSLTVCSNFSSILGYRLLNRDGMLKQTNKQKKKAQWIWCFVDVFDLNNHSFSLVGKSRWKLLGRIGYIKNLKIFVYTNYFFSVMKANLSLSGPLHLYWDSTIIIPS